VGARHSLGRGSGVLGVVVVCVRLRLRVAGCTVVRVLWAVNPTLLPVGSPESVVSRETIRSAVGCVCVWV